MREITFAQAIGEALAEEMWRDERVILLGEDIGIFGGIFGVTQGLLDAFGERRIYDTPISEMGIIGCAVGAALVGLRPVAELMFIDFVTAGFDQLVNQAAKLRYMSGGKMKVPMVVRAPFGAGINAASQHSQSPYAWFVQTPGLKVVIPSSPYDAKGLLKSSIRDENPVVFLEHKLLYNLKAPVPEEEYLVSFGKAEVKREGRDITVVAIGYMVVRAMNAAEKLSKEGISLEVIDPKTLVPLDLATIRESVKKTHRLLVIDEAPKPCSMASEIVASMAEELFGTLKAPPRRLCTESVPIPFSKPLEDFILITEEKIEVSVKEILKGGRKPF